MQRFNYLALVFVMVAMSSCELVGDIFEAGIWTGLIIVAVVIALVIWIISRFMR